MQALAAVLAVVLPAMVAAVLLVVCLVAGGERVQAAMNATMNATVNAAATASVSAPAPASPPGEWAPAKAGANPLEKLRPLLKPSAPSGLLQEVAAPIAVQQLQEALADRQPRVTIEVPVDGANLPSGNWTLKLNVQDWPLHDGGALGIGPHVVVQIDEQAPVRLSEHRSAGKGEAVQISLPPLAPGSHRITAYAATPWGEAARTPGAVSQIRVHRVAANPLTLPEAGSPQVLGVSPLGSVGGEPVLLDWLLLDAPLQHLRDNDGSWRLRIAVNDEHFVVDQNVPLWLKGWKTGSNSLQLELVDGRGKPLNPPFNSLVSEVVLKPSSNQPRWQQGRLSPAELATLLGQTPPPAQPISAPTAKPPSAKPPTAPAAGSTDARPQPLAQQPINPNPVALKPEAPAPKAPAAEAQTPAPTEPRPAQPAHPPANPAPEPSSAETPAADLSETGLSDTDAPAADQSAEEVSTEDQFAAVEQPLAEQPLPEQPLAEQPDVDQSLENRLRQTEPADKQVLDQGPATPPSDTASSEESSIENPSLPTAPEELAQSQPEQAKAQLAGETQEEDQNEEQEEDADLPLPDLAEPANPSGDPVNPTSQTSPPAPKPITNPDRLSPSSNVAGSARDQVREDGSLIKPKREGFFGGLLDRIGA